MQTRRDFVGNLAKLIAGYNLSSNSAEIAIKATEVISPFRSVDSWKNNALPAMDQLIKEMVGRGTVGAYRNLISRTARMLKDYPDMSLKDLMQQTGHLRMSLASINAMNPDIIACFEEYMEGHSIKEAFTDPQMIKKLELYMDSMFSGFPNIAAAKKETLKVLSMNPSDRIAYLDENLGISQLKEKATALIEKIEQRKAELIEAQNTDPLKGKCDVWEKVQLKEYGYNIKVHRQQVKKHGFTVDETYSEWESRTKIIAAALKTKFPDVQINHTSFQQGRIIALLEKGSKADEYFSDFNKKPEKEIFRKPAVPIRLGI